MLKGTRGNNVSSTKTEDGRTSTQPEITITVSKSQKANLGEWKRVERPQWPFSYHSSRGKHSENRTEEISCLHKPNTSKTYPLVCTYHTVVTSFPDTSFDLDHFGKLRKSCKFY